MSSEAIAPDRVSDIAQGFDAKEPDSITDKPWYDLGAELRARYLGGAA